MKPLALALALVLAATGAGCASAPRRAASEGARDRSGTACALCGRPVGAEWLEWHGGVYHPACYDRAGPVCGVCRAVIRGPHVVLARCLPYHERCLADTLRCEGCGLPAEGERGGASRLPDGRVTCAACRREAVNDANAARQACREAREALHAVLGLDLGDLDPPVLLVSKPDLLARAGALAHPALKALTEVEDRVAPDGSIAERRYRIYALDGLPRAGLVGVLAHELFHVLQSEATAASVDPALREGAANYAQVRILRSKGEEVRARLLEEVKDPVYGEGLRRVERLARDRGDRAALDAGLRGTRFPEGY